MNKAKRSELDAPTGSVDIVELLRATRRSVVPRLIEYRTTDSRIVDAVRLLDMAADEIERQRAEIERWRDSNNRFRAEMEHQSRRAQTLEDRLHNADLSNAKGHPEAIKSENIKKTS